jgi:hypothetical protein
VISVGVACVPDALATRHYLREHHRVERSVLEIWHVARVIIYLHLGANSNGARA